jgi:hypothetical protein
MPGTIDNAARNMIAKFTDLRLVVLFLLLSESYSFVSTFRWQPVPPLAMSKGDTAVSLPGRTFMDCVKQAAAGAKSVLSNGDTLIEIEFPPLPQSYLDDSASSARDIADANTRWALEFAKTFTELGEVKLLYPDIAEVRDAIKYVDLPGGASPFPNMTLCTARTSSVDNAVSLDQLVSSVFGQRFGGTVTPFPDAKMYIALVFSTQELPDLEKLYQAQPDVPIVFFNLQLDKVRLIP